MAGNQITEAGKRGHRRNQELNSAKEFCSQKVVSCRFHNRRVQRTFEPRRLCGVVPKAGMLGIPTRKFVVAAT